MRHREAAINALQAIGGHIGFGQNAASGCFRPFSGLLPSVWNERIDSIDLGNTTFSDGDIGLLRCIRDVQSLNLCRTKVSDASLAEIEMLRCLSVLDVSETNLTPDGIVELQLRLPHCSIRPDVIRSSTIRLLRDELKRSPRLDSQGE